MNNIEYINNTFIIKRTENYINYYYTIDYDTNILQLIDKKYITKEEEGSFPEVEYVFKILYNKSTKIKLTENHNTYGETIEYIDINKRKNDCLIS
jgi:hypothetical protein